MKSHLASRFELPKLARTQTRVLALALLLMAPAACIIVDAEPVETTTRSFEHSLPLAAGDTLRLANLAGSVEFVAAEAGVQDVRIEATVHANARDEATTQRLLDDMAWVASEDPKGLDEWALSYPVEDYDTFHYQREGSFSWGWNSSTRYRGERVTIRGSKGSAPSLWVDLRIALPAEGKLVLRNLSGRVHGGSLQGNLVVDTGDGDVEFEGFDGELMVDTGSGEVELGTVRGQITIDTGSGDIRVDEAIGNVDLDTGSGDVRVEKVAAGRLVVDTGSGSVVVADGSAGDLEIDTGSGDVVLDGVDAVNALIDTGSGDVRVDSPLQQARVLTIDTGSGDVRIYGGADASFALNANMRRRQVDIGYDDVSVQSSRGTQVVRGDGRTRIEVRTGSGSCSIRPR